MFMELSKLLAKARNAVRMLENNECGLDKIQEEAAMRTLDYYMTGNSHFTELSARGCIAQMYYFKSDFEKEYAPFFEYEKIKEEYDKIKEDIPDYNAWDFAVTMNLIYSNHHGSIEKWKSGTVISRISKMAIEFLNDEDSLHPDDKIWWYMNT